MTDDQIAYDQKIQELKRLCFCYEVVSATLDRFVVDDSLSQTRQILDGCHTTITRQMKQLQFYQRMAVSG